MSEEFMQMDSNACEHTRQVYNHSKEFPYSPESNKKGMHASAESTNISHCSLQLFTHAPKCRLASLNTERTKLVAPQAVATLYYLHKAKATRGFFYKCKEPR
jgi:hypothetical protein